MYLKTDDYDIRTVDSMADGVCKRAYLLTGLKYRVIKWIVNSSGNLSCVDVAFFKTKSNAIEHINHL